MKRTCIVLALLLFGLSARVSAQTVNWTEPNVASATQAQGFTPRLYVTPSGSTTTNAAVVLTSVTCSGTGTAPITVTCQAPLPATATAALVTGAKVTLTEQDTSSGTAESGQSTPFITGAAVPTLTKVQ